MRRKKLYAVIQRHMVEEKLELNHICRCMEKLEQGVSRAQHTDEPAETRSSTMQKWCQQQPSNGKVLLGRGWGQEEGPSGCWYNYEEENENLVLLTTKDDHHIPSNLEKPSNKGKQEGQHRYKHKHMHRHLKPKDDHQKLKQYLRQSYYGRSWGRC